LIFVAAHSRTARNTGIVRRQPAAYELQYFAFYSHQGFGLLQPSIGAVRGPGCTGFHAILAAAQPFKAIEK
jgi:hypothetical protein